MSDEKKTSEGAEAAAAESVTLPKAEVDGLRAKVEEYLNLAQRVQADFSNYQKRVARDRDEQARFLVERLLLDLLPALDAFGLALKSPGADVQALAEGMKLAEREIFRKLELHGLKRIAAEGEFRPAVHEAIMQVATDKVAEGSVVAELRAGFTLNERVLRPAQVSVAKKP